MGLFTQSETMRFTDAVLDMDHLQRRLADRFELEVLEERDCYRKISIERIFGGRIHPQFEQPLMEIWLFPEKQALTYTITWPKYYAVLIALVLFGAGWLARVRTIWLVLGAMFVAAGVTWLDHREIGKDLRRALLTLPGIEEVTPAAVRGREELQTDNKNGSPEREPPSPSRSS